MMTNKNEFELKHQEKESSNKQNVEKMKKTYLSQIDDLGLAKAKLQEDYNNQKEKLEIMKENKEEKIQQSLST